MGEEIKPIMTTEEIDSLFVEAEKLSNFDSIKTKVQEKLYNYVDQSYTDEDLENLQERLYKMIDYASTRYDYYSSQRLRFLTLGIGFIASSATFIGILINNSENFNLVTKILGFSGLTALLLTGISMLLTYAAYTTPKYPYRKIMDIHSWYFKYKFSDKIDYKLSNNKKKSFNQVKEVTKEYFKSVENWVAKSKQTKYFIKEDIEQVIILQLLQKYERDCVDKMKRNMIFGIWLFIILFILSGLYELYVYLFPITCG